MVVKCQLIIFVFWLNQMFLILVLLTAVARASKNSSRSASLEPFRLAEALVMKVCLDSKRYFRSTHLLYMYFLYLDFANLKYRSFLQFSWYFKAWFLTLSRLNIKRYLIILFEFSFAQRYLKNFWNNGLKGVARTRFKSLTISAKSSTLDVWRFIGVL